MARYSKDFTPVADLKRKREAEAALKARFARREPPRALSSAGAGFAAAGNKAAAAHMRSKALRDWQSGEDRRLADVKKQYYGEQASAGKSALAHGADLQKQRIAGKQQLGLAKFRAKEDRNLQELRGQQQLRVQQLKGSTTRAGQGTGAKGALTAKNKFDIRKGLQTEFYGDNPAGEALRKKYGDNGFGMFATQMEQRYAPQQQQPGPVALPQPPAQVRPFKDPSTGVWRGGQIEQPATLPSAGSALSPGQLPVSQPAMQQQGGLDTRDQPVSMMAPQENMRLGAAFTPPQSLSEFDQGAVGQREAKLAEAFGRPLKKKALPLPGSQLASSLRDNVLRKRAMREGRGSYYNR
jgi:hypothetical protein